MTPIIDGGDLQRAAQALFPERVRKAAKAG